MQPDRETSLLLEQFQSVGTAELVTATIESARAGVEAMFASSAATPPPVADVIDGSLRGEGGELAYRLYRSSTTEDSRAALLFVHGGGWWLCSTATHDSVARWLCHYGALDVLSLEYRLAPEHRFPAALNDVRSATEWLFENAARLGIDHDRIAIGGDSAGGALCAAAASLSRRNPRERFAAMMLLYPTLTLGDATDLPSRRAFGGGEYFLTDAAIEVAANYYLHDPSLRTDPRVSPLLERDLCGMPQSLIVTAGFDPLRDEGEQYATRLRQCGVDVDYRCFESTIHGFMSFSRALSVGREGLEFAGRWLGARLHSTTHPSPLA